jgi:hypothetical protein
MSQGIDLFIWHRPAGGFSWRDGRVLAPENQKDLTSADRAETRFLVPNPMETSRHWRYNPLAKHPTLFREFANLEPTEEAYASFASEYGDLGIGVFVDASTTRQLETAISDSVHDPFCRWRSAHAHIRAVADVLSAIQSEDAAVLKQWFTVTKNGARYHRKDPVTFEALGWVTIAGELRDYVWTWATQANSDAEALLRIARGWAQERINEAIGGERQPGTNCSARVVFDQDRGHMTLRIVPETLIGAMWFQCARVLTLNPVFRACKQCGRWFELGPDTRRKQSIYCSDRCKVAAYRAKKANRDVAAGRPA